MCPRDKDEGWREDVFQSAWGRTEENGTQLGKWDGRWARMNRGTVVPI